MAVLPSLAGVAAETAPAKGQWTLQELIGRPVVDRVGTPVGKVADLVLGSNQTVQEVVVLVGGAQPPHIVEVPWQLASWGLSGDAVSLPLEAQDVKGLQRNIERFQAPTASQWLGSRLVGTRVVSPSGDPVGTVGAVAFDSGGRILRYDISRSGGGRGDVPASRVRLDSRLGVVEIAEVPR